jgi:microcystin-dependent protein
VRPPRPHHPRRDASGNSRFGNQIINPNSSAITAHDHGLSAAPSSGASTGQLDATKRNASSNTACAGIATDSRKPQPRFPWSTVAAERSFAGLPQQHGRIAPARRACISDVMIVALRCGKNVGARWRNARSQSQARI